MSSIASVSALLNLFAVWALTISCGMCIREFCFTCSIGLRPEKQRRDIICDVGFRVFQSS